MDLKYLNTFKTIVETGNFSNAAHKLNYTQSTLTFQIQQLEKELSFKLFEKIGRNMIVTQAGKDILPYIDMINQSVDQIKNYGKCTENLTGELKVVMPETLLTYKMQPIFKEFRLQAPHVKLSVQSLNCYDIRDNLSKGNAEIGVHYDVGGYKNTIYTQKLQDFETVLVASNLLDDSLCDFCTPNQIKPLCLITNDKRSIFHKIFDNYLKEKNIIIDETMELGSIESIKRSVISNLGVAYLPRYVVADEIESKSLKILDVKIPNNTITAILAYHKNKWISPAMELFLKLLKDNFHIE